MRSDFLYPNIADRQSPEDWVKNGHPTINAAARAVVTEMLASGPDHKIPPDIDLRIRDEFNILLPPVRQAN